MRFFLLILMMFTITTQSVLASEVNNISIEEAMHKLKAGNDRFIHMKLKHPDQSLIRREELVKGQHPFVVVITCSDSRVSPEIIFDQGLGDIFEIRNAGNVLDDHVIGSIEYAVAHLNTPVVLVLGHQNCGAVTAAVHHSHESIHIESLVEAIAPAVKCAEQQKGDLLDNAIKNNVVNVVNELKKSEPIIKKYIESDKLKVIGGYYHLDTGKVDYISN